MMTFRKAMAGVMAGGAAAAMAGCSTAASGPAQPTGAQIKSAVDSATSVHIAGSVVQNGQTESLDAGFLRTGQWSGNITAGTVPTISVIVTGGKAYILLTQAFMQSAVGKSASCGGICGKYLTVSGSQASSLTGAFSFTQIVDPLGTGLNGVSPSGTTTVDGQEAFVYKGADNTVLDVAAHGKPYPLRVSGPKEGTLILSDWNSVPTPAAPPASQIVSQNSI
jgi:hypothetical protein